MVKKQIVEPKLPKLPNGLEKLIEPNKEKKKYLMSLNENILSIKKNTKNNIKENFLLTKKQEEIVKISNQMILYNNPSNL